MVLNEPMRTAAATTTGTALYSNVVDSCQHSRLRAALGGSAAPVARRTDIAASATPAGEATKAYFWVVGMCVLSLLSIIVTGTFTA